MKSQQQLQEFRHLGDPLADDVIKAIYQEGQRELKDYLNSTICNKDLTGLKDKSGQLALLIESIHLPAWSNMRKLEAGQKLYRKYSVEMSAILGLYSLPYCYAAANGAKVLIHSRNILDKPEKRLSETAQFVVDIMDENAFQPSGRGYLSILKVRLLHATARFFASRHIDFEVPVNQEDLAGTNLAFSLICLRGIADIGINLSLEEREAYIHSWNIIGFMLGIESELLPVSVRQAVSLERAIRKHQFTYSEEGEKLTSALTNYMQKQLSSSFPLKSSDLVGYFLGDEVSRCVGINRSPGLTSALISSVRFRNLLTDFTQETFTATSRLVQQQVSDSNGTYFHI